MYLIHLTDVRGQAHTVVVRRVVEITGAGQSDSPNNPLLVLDGQVRPIDISEETAAQLTMELRDIPPSKV